MTYTITKSRVESWGYEITAKGFHNIAPTVETAIKYLQGRFGYDVKYRVKEEKRNEVLQHTAPGGAG